MQHTKIFLLYYSLPGDDPINEMPEKYLTAIKLIDLQHCSQCK